MHLYLGGRRRLEAKFNDLECPPISVKNNKLATNAESEIKLELSQKSRTCLNYRQVAPLEKGWEQRFLTSLFPLIPIQTSAHSWFPLPEASALPLYQLLLFPFQFLSLFLRNHLLHKQTNKQVFSHHLEKPPTALDPEMGQRKRNERVQQAASREKMRTKHTKSVCLARRPLTPCLAGAAQGCLFCGLGSASWMNQAQVQFQVTLMLTHCCIVCHLIIKFRRGLGL